MIRNPPPPTPHHQEVLRAQHTGSTRDAVFQQKLIPHEWRDGLGNSACVGEIVLGPLIYVKRGSNGAGSLRWAAVLGSLGSQKTPGVPRWMAARYGAVFARARRGEALVLEILCLIINSLCIITLCCELGMGWVLPKASSIHPQ